MATNNDEEQMQARGKQPRRPVMSTDVAVGSIKAHLGEQAESHVAVNAFVATFANVPALGATADDAPLTALNASALHALLEATQFTPADDIRVAVDVILSKARRPSISQTGRGKQKHVGAPDRIGVAEVTWLLTQPSKAGAESSTGAGSKKRRSEHGDAAFASMVESSPLLAKIKRELRDTTLITANTTRTPLPPAEFDALVASLSQPLPMSFRVHRGDACLHAAACNVLNGWQRMGRFTAVVPSPIFCGCAAATPIRMMDHAAYHLPENIEVELGCRNGHSAGLWSFQELVSMLPVTALRIEPHHRVLDMCAAPGSKTLQALDALLAQGQRAATGVVIANEVDRLKSRQTLPSRLKRHHSANAVVTRSDATMFPNIVTNDDHAVVKFDRIVCDVPCSGDGTARKDTSVWTGWSDEYAESLLKTQRSLLLRAVDLLAVNGIVAYSTCSMNPQEDEEVVARCLDCYGDEVELLDVNAVLKAEGVLIHSAGGVEVAPAVAVRSVAEADGVAAARLESQKHIASRVLRVLPHRDDTGGFFVALIKRVQPHKTDPPTMTKMNNWTNVKRFVPVTENSAFAADWAKAVEGFGLPATPADLHPVAMLTPNGEAKKFLLASAGALRVVLQSQLRKGPGVEVISVGMRAFEKLDPRYLPDSTQRYRMSGEAAHILGPLATKRVVRITDRADVIELLKKGYLNDRIPEEVKQLDGSPGVGPVVLRLLLQSADDEAEDVFWAAGVLTNSKLDLTVDANIRRVLLKYRLHCHDSDVTNGLQREDRQNGGGSDVDDDAVGTD